MLFFERSSIPPRKHFTCLVELSIFLLYSGTNYTEKSLKSKLNAFSLLNAEVPMVVLPVSLHNIPNVSPPGTAIVLV